MKRLTLSRQAIYKRSKNQVAAKAKIRLAPRNAEMEVEPIHPTPKIKIQPDCVIILRFPKAKQSRSISIHRFGDKYSALGKSTKLSGLMTRISIVIEGLTHN